MRVCIHTYVHTVSVTLDPCMCVCKQPWHARQGMTLSSVETVVSTTTRRGLAETYLHTYAHTYIGHPFNTLCDLEHLLHNFACVYIHIRTYMHVPIGTHWQLEKMAVSTRQVNSFMQKVSQQKAQRMTITHLSEARTHACNSTMYKSKTTGTHVHTHAHTHTICIHRYVLKSNIGKYHSPIHSLTD